MWLLAGFVWAIWLHQSSSATEILYSNGWIPIASETIFNQLNHQQPAVALHPIQVIYTDVNKINEDLPANGNNDADYKGIENKEKADENVICDEDCNNENMNFQIDSNYFTPNVYQLSATYNDTKARKSKHMFENPKNMLDMLNNEEIRDKTLKDEEIKEFKVIEHDLGDEKKNEKQNGVKNEEIKRYEVIENGLEDEEKSESQNGYSYEPKNEFTSKLYDILSKYKIRENDKLSNYDLSRRQKSLLSSKIFLPPFQKKSNNLNHLPADPLLAVFLSNYGFYLRGMYGIHNNYNNLYGYLASNNIHNNKPFGFYKIFSDTDSSH